MKFEQYRFNVLHHIYAIGMSGMLIFMCMSGLSACGGTKVLDDDTVVTSQTPDIPKADMGTTASPDGILDMSSFPVASERSYAGIWLLNDMETTLMDKVVHYDRTFIQSYQKMTEATCGLELGNDGYCNIALVGYTDVTDWKIRNDENAIVHVPFVRQDTGEDMVTDALMTIDKSTDTLSLHIEIPAESIPQWDGTDMPSSDIRCQFIRQKHSAANTLAACSASDHAENEAFYGSLVLEDDDSVEERVLAEDENSQIKLLGRTHDEDSDTVGYLLRVTNKTEHPLILNHFLNPLFTAHGIAASATYTRPLPGRIISEETREELFAPVLAYLSFPRESVGDDLSDLHGSIFLTDYNWSVQSSYDISL